MVDIQNLSYDELQEYLVNNSFKPYNASQIFDWLYKKNSTDFNSMSNLSKSLREFLIGNFVISNMKIMKKSKSNDGTVKILWELSDGQTVESVALFHPNHITFCISTQVGCALGCEFCATGRNGFVRDLSAAEIINQVIFLENAIKGSVKNIVYMGMGEPFLNYDNVIKSINTLNHPKGKNIGIRNFTISTSGIIPGIDRLSNEEKIPRLSVSLHSVDNKKRSYLMPINSKYSLDDLITSLEKFQKKTKDRITFEYILIKNFNCSIEDAHQISKKLKNIKKMMNLIPVNPVDKRFKRPSEDEISIFMKELEALGVTAVLRNEKGTDIDAACGQLRRRISES
ncbi:MAG: rRNA (adenine2503-C2)-methyltransferase [Kosmotogales bacterium]|nr:rRNA (adenine2503-C2)-methyltransferase [Kosmotogales bacterium]